VIARVQGTLLSREPDRVEVETSGGVVYEVEVPATVLTRLPAVGGFAELRTVQVVTESSVALYGFIDGHERTLFKRLLSASGVGPKLALQMMSTFRAERLALALVEKDIAALTQVSGIGKKKAEKIALELADKVDDLTIAAPIRLVDSGPRVQEAVQALIALGYSYSAADEAVRTVLQTGGVKTTEELIRRALAGE